MTGVIAHASTMTYNHRENRNNSIAIKIIVKTVSIRNLEMASAETMTDVILETMMIGATT
ncbi:hypothetical protein DPMN_080265 [Dreissena polymorpha]|uniref:Uncharacterized protein n=1 Tax=Dreissena polymorpha TaxID=45954 RepID=A0A9D4BQT5_DREPO|nr:hypothetical protein DPMN_080265 [Dreissena polymorpha]